MPCNARVTRIKREDDKRNGVEKNIIGTVKFPRIQFCAQSSAEGGATRKVEDEEEAAKKLSTLMNNVHVPEASSAFCKREFHPRQPGLVQRINKLSSGCVLLLPV